MKRILFLLILLISLKLHPDANYIIYDSKGESGYLTLSISGDSVFERVLLTDGFSREYTVSSYSMKGGCSYRSVSYFADDQLPVKINFNGKVLTRVSSGIKSSLNVKVKNLIVYNGSAPASSALLLREGRSKWQVINAYSFKYIKDPAEKFICFGKSTYPDSIISGNYILRKTDRFISVENPYFIDYSSFYIRDDFSKKKIILEVSIGEGAKGELLMDAMSDTVAVILPFGLNYDMYGNMSSQAAPFTTLQVAEGISMPAYIFEFTAAGKRDFQSLSKTLRDVDAYFSARYGKVVYIVFNELNLLAADAIPHATIVAVNPILEECKSYSDMIFSRSNKRMMLFTDRERFLSGNPIFTNFEFSDPLKIYSKLKGNRAYILSWSVLSDNERKNSKRLAGRVVKMKNIDRRLNDNILYDLWSFKKKIKLSDKVIRYLNSLIIKL